MQNISDMNLIELSALKKRIEKRMAFLRAQNLKDAKAEVRRVAKKYGVSLYEVAGSQKERKVSPNRSRVGSKKVAIKYVSSVDPSLTWSGRGRRPKWVSDELESGLRLSDLLQ